MLRTGILSQIEELSLEERQKIEQRLRCHLYDSFLWKEAETIGITYSTRREWNTVPIIKRAWQEGKKLVIPKMRRKTAGLDFYEINHFSQTEIGYKQIVEPIESKCRFVHKKEIDLLIVPGVVFDYAGYRVGFGGGYYDRYLEDFKQRTVSLVSLMQLVQKLPIEKHDLHVQYLITEEGLHKVKR